MASTLRLTSYAMTSTEPTKNKHNREKRLLLSLNSPSFLSPPCVALPVTTETHSHSALISNFDSCSTVEGVRKRAPALTLSIPQHNPKDSVISSRTPGSQGLLSTLFGSANSSRVDLLQPEPPTATSDGPQPTPRDSGVPSSAGSASRSYFPRLRRQISNISIRSTASSIFGRYLFGQEATPPSPQVETTPAVGKIETNVARASIDTLNAVAKDSNIPIPVILEPSSPAVAESPKSALLPDFPAPPRPQLNIDTTGPAELIENGPIKALHSLKTTSHTQAVAIPKSGRQGTHSRLQPPTPDDLRQGIPRSLPNYNENPELKQYGGPTLSSSHPDPSGRVSRLTVASSQRSAMSGKRSETDRLKKRERGWNTGRPVPEPSPSNGNKKRRPNHIVGGHSHSRSRSKNPLGNFHAKDKNLKNRNDVRNGADGIKRKDFAVPAQTAPDPSPIIDSATTQSPVETLPGSASVDNQTPQSSNSENTDVPTVRSPIRTSTISSKMSAELVISQLVKNGCPNVTQELDIERCEPLPFAGGGFGDVYHGMLVGGRKVAIKCPRLYLHGNGNRSKIVKKIAHEIYAWSKLKHDNVLPLTGLATYKDHISMVSPWMDNGTLRQYIEKNPSADRFQLCTQISAGLTYLHSCGVVHGDMKGMNVLISDTGEPKITDFGNTVLRKYTMDFTGGTTTLKVSVRWTAPELFEEDAASYTKPADVFALGMCGKETITGEIPFQKKPDPVVGVLLSTGKTPKIPAELKGVTIMQADLLRRVMKDCWSQDPLHRPTAAQIEFKETSCGMSNPTATTNGYDSGDDLSGWDPLWNYWYACML
ncbi:Serine/threonine-protein kinase [Ceratobasidium sp. AG-Ba]|nr:Serine/threonine-protein kinase [Ceratobasidium sp. AG-Ba]